MPTYVAERGEWFAGNIFTNPADGDILVDTGALGQGNFLVAVVGAANAAWVYDVQQRNAANTANIDSQRRRPASGNEDFPFPCKVFVTADERFRVVLSGAVTGQIQASLFVLAVP